tara:strand:- start:483 stop:1235 length:753 start_codon:yes stop_codon:yes gene_type:complete
MAASSVGNLLPFKLVTQNSRVNRLSDAFPDIRPEQSTESAADIIEKCYRQIFFHSMSCDREPFLESQFKDGSITIRDFVRGLLLSERFYRGYVACSSNYRLVEQVVGRVLGRPVFGEDEKRAWAVVIAEKGFAGFVDEILDSPEYMGRFGYDSVPEQVSRKLPGRPIGEIPIYQRLPRYGEEWRDRMVNDSLMMSVVEFNKISNPLTVSRLIYEKPEGRILKFWLAFLVIAASTSVVIVLSVVNAMFTIR